MPRTNKVTQLTVVIPRGTEDDIKRLADMEKKNISEYIRWLIEQYAKDHNLHIDLAVEQRGGYRPKQPA